MQVVRIITCLRRLLTVEPASDGLLSPSLAMSYPASGVESTYRNNLKDVAKMLKTKHQENYMVRQTQRYMHVDRQTDRQSCRQAVLLQ